MNKDNGPIPTSPLFALINKDSYGSVNRGNKSINSASAIPNWLQGCLIRNGPGSLKVGDNEFCHLFDSSALLHRFAIKNGKITYQCRFLRSETFKRNWAANRIVLTEFGTKSVPDPCRTIFQRIAAIFTSKLSDNAMISVYPFGDELYTFCEIPIIHKINPETLSTEMKVDIGKYVSILNHTSHPHVVRDGTVYNLGLSLFPSGLHHIIVCYPKKEIGEDKMMFEKAKIVGAVPARWPLHPSYMHTFGITENYFVIVEQPLSVSIPQMAILKLKEEPLAGCFQWYQDEYTRISVISRQTGNVSHTFYAEAFFYLHIIHQYEVDDYIVLDICIYRDPSMLDCMYIETMRELCNLDSIIYATQSKLCKYVPSRPARFVLPLNPDIRRKEVSENLVSLENTNARAHYLPDGKIFVEPEQICNLGCETPRINYDHYLSKPYRYFYAISSDVDAENPGTLIKVDVSMKTAKTWCEKKLEPVFVPHHDFQQEDDGVVLAAMIWGGEDTNHVGLIILDAKTFYRIRQS
ncbi:hypothetical protein NQ318_001237 [Aromia moschata]|uniref:Carotenoid isomerooxygenase n=1 Tax=Aromia moschata TaxID=1265417 RepID=A0AAV8ZHA0_9CUCU|nr:hypothetical protein NQ318_001237 [Aromia moschata]